jgi:negative regulator of sigma E activity
MNRELDIEAALDRSLARQIRPAPLDGSFDSAVWARIAAEEARVARATPELARAAPRSLRWLAASNALGLAVAAVLAVVFGLKAFGGAEFGIAVPQLSAATLAQLTDFAIKGITGAAIVFGLMFTPLGRWLRAEFS